MPIIVGSDGVRLGFVCPSLLEGGAENWQLDLFDALNANPPAAGLSWQGVVCLDDPRNASPTMLAATRAKLPVAFGEDALYSMASACNVLISWAVYPYTALTAVMTTPPHVIHVAHRTEPWGTTAESWLAPVAKVVAVSSLAASQVPASFSARSSTILNAIDPSRLAVSADRATKWAAWGIPADTPRVIGFLGRLEPEKDPQAMARLVAFVPPAWRCVVVGEGSQAASVSGAYNPNQNLVLVGADPDAGSCLNAFDWLVDASTVNSFGYSVAEAWWQGVPVVGTTVGLASLQPSFVQPIPVHSDGIGIWSSIDVDAKNPNFTSSRVQAAQSWARSNLAPAAFGQAWAALLQPYGAGGGPAGG
jgi:glycosyltransferase involved in cell wall biosynthesis